MSYALIKDGVVVNVIEASPELVSELAGYDDVIETKDAMVGWTWGGGVFTPPPEPRLPADPQRRYVTRLAFRNRFTQPEKAALEMAALDNPQADMSVRSQAAGLRAYMKDVDSATFIDLDRADTRAGVQMLEAGGLLAAGRAAEILDAPVQPEEAPQ